MNCLVCGHKLAIFRKLSLGDFCCQEHRALFMKEQGERGLARLRKANGGERSRAIGPRAYPYFLEDAVGPCLGLAETASCGPLAVMRLAPFDVTRLLSPTLAPPQQEFFESISSEPRPIAVEMAGTIGLPPVRLPGKYHPTLNRVGM